MSTLLFYPDCPQEDIKGEDGIMVSVFLRTSPRQRSLSLSDGQRAFDSSVRQRHNHSAIDFELEIGEDTPNNMNCSGVVLPSGPVTNTTHVTLDSNSPSSTPATLPGCESNNCGLCQAELNVSFTPALSQVSSLSRNWFSAIVWTLT